MEIRAIYILFTGFFLLSLFTISGLILYAHFQSRDTHTAAIPSETLPVEEHAVAQVTQLDPSPSPAQVLGSQSSPAPEIVTDRDFQDRLYSLINAYRKESKVSPLQVSKALEISAGAKLHDMQQRKYWAHLSPEGTPPWDFFTAAGYDYLYAGENLSTGHTTPWNVFSNWQESQAHRSEMIKPEYTQMGSALDCSYRTGSSSSCVVVLHFGTPR